MYIFLFLWGLTNLLLPYWKLSTVRRINLFFPSKVLVPHAGIMNKELVLGMIIFTWFFKIFSLAIFYVDNLAFENSFNILSINNITGTGNLPHFTNYWYLWLSTLDFCKKKTSKINPPFRHFFFRYRTETSTSGMTMTLKFIQKLNYDAQLGTKGTQKRTSLTLYNVYWN